MRNQTHNKTVDFETWYSQTRSSPTCSTTSCSIGIGDIHAEHAQKGKGMNNTLPQYRVNLPVFERLYVHDTCSSEQKRRSSLNNSPTKCNANPRSLTFSPENSVHNRLSISPTVTSKTKKEFRVKLREEVTKKVEEQRKARNGELIPNYGSLSPSKANSIYYRGMLKLAKRDVVSAQYDPNYKSKIDIDKVIEYSKLHTEKKYMGNKSYKSD